MATKNQETYPGYSATGRFLLTLVNGALIWVMAFIGILSGWVNVMDHGALGDGMTDDTVAIQAAIAASSSLGKIVYFPPGEFLYTHLDVRTYNGCMGLRGCYGLQWTGNYGNTSAQPATVLRCISDTDEDGIEAFQMQGMTVQDLQFEYLEGYTGDLLNIGSNPDNNSGVGTNTVLVSRCRFISDHTGSYNTAHSFISLNNTVMITLEDCSFMGAESLVRGVRDSAVDSFANCVMIKRCQFEGCTVGQIVNPWLNWSIDDCLFELTNPLVPCAITSDSSSDFGGSTTDISVTNCRFWDAADGATQIPIIQPAGVNWKITIRDCWFHNFNQLLQMNGNGSFIFEANRTLIGVPIPAETLIDCGDPDTAYKDMIRIVGNDWSSNGSQDLAIINYAGHGSHAGAVKIENNTQTGPWDNGSGGGGSSAFVVGPSAVHLNDSNSGTRFLGGTVILDSGVSVGSEWEFHSNGYTTELCVITLGVGCYIYKDGAADNTTVAIQVDNGYIKITKTEPDATAGFAKGFYNIAVHGGMTLS